MKNLLLSLTILITTVTFGQKEVITISLNDGNSYEAKSYSGSKESLEVKTISGETIKIPYNKLNKIEIQENGNVKTKKYIPFQKKGGRIMELIVEGKINVYKDASSSGYTYGHGSLGGGTNFYVKRDNERAGTYMGNQNVGNIMNFKKRALEYFDDCPEIIDSINENFNRKKIPELVVHYNTICM